MKALRALSNDICDLKLIERCSPTAVRKWPTFTNHAASQGIEYWEKFIDATNYFQTCKLYTKPEHVPYLEWLLGRTFTDKLAIQRQIAHMSPSDSMIVRYCKDVMDTNEKCMDICLLKNDSSGASSLLEKTNPVAEELCKYLHTSLSCMSSECTMPIVLAIEKQLAHKPRPLCPNVWKDLLAFNDHHVVIRMAEHLRLTETKDEYNILGMNYRKFKILLLASPGDVTIALNEEESGCVAGYLSLVASRVAEEPEYVCCLKEYMQSRRLLDDWDFNTELIRGILYSRRSPEKTFRLIDILNREGLIFTGKFGFDIAYVTVSSWEAIQNMENPRSALNLSKAFVQKRGPCSDYFVRKNRSFYRQLYKSVFGCFSPECRLYFFTLMGSSLTKWAYGSGLLEEIICTFDTAKSAAFYGNVFMLALVIDKLNGNGTVVTEDNFMKLNVHKESIPFLACWFKSTAAQKQEFFSTGYGTKSTAAQKQEVFSTGYGTYFFDTSSQENSLLTSFYMGSMVCQMELSDTIFLDCQTMKELMEEPLPLEENPEMEEETFELLECPVLNQLTELDDLASTTYEEYDMATQSSQKILDDMKKATSLVEKLEEMDI